MIIESTFKPAWWLKNGHLQTLWGSLLRQTDPINTSHQRLELDDGDFIDLQWSVNNKLVKKPPVLLLLHGLEGSINSIYMQGMLQASRSTNWQTVVMHFRGCSQETNRLPRSYHSGDTEDLKQALLAIKTRYPDSKIMVAGFSLGGNVLLKYLGEMHIQSKIDFAAAISVPFLLSKASARLDRGFSRLYRNHLLSELKKKTLSKLSTHEMELFLSESELAEITTFFDFDDRVTAPVHGFKGADDYYQQSSSRQFLSSIATPTLILHAVDDPFMTEEVIPAEQELSKFVTLELSKYGGHVGFVAGKFPWSAQYYIDYRIPAWFKEQLTVNE